MFLCRKIIIFTGFILCHSVPNIWCLFGKYEIWEAWEPYNRLSCCFFCTVMILSYLCLINVLLKTHAGTDWLCFSIIPASTCAYVWIHPIPTRIVLRSTIAEVTWVLQDVMSTPWWCQTFPLWVFPREQLVIIIKNW